MNTLHGKYKKMIAGGIPTEDDAFNAIMGYNSVVNPSAGRTSIRPAGSNGLFGTAAGGTPAASNTAGAVGAAASLGTGLVNAIDTPNNYGNISTVGSTATGLLAGAATGAVAGSVVPGIGTVAGAVVGGVIGGVTGLIKGKKMRKQEAQSYKDAIEGRRKYDEAVSKALTADPTLVNGRIGAEYYRNGGAMTAPLSTKYMMGGHANSLNSNSVEVIGNTHEEGGIKIPSMGTELEDKETTSGNFVFSENLGFAKRHKPIAKAIGKIEKKAQTPERIFSLERLKERETALANEQEDYKLFKGIMNS